MEQQLFTWSGWDQYDTMDFSFYDCEFIADFGPFKAGDKFSSIFVIYSEGVMHLYKDACDEEPVTVKFKLEFVE